MNVQSCGITQPFPKIFQSRENINNQLSPLVNYCCLIQCWFTWGHGIYLFCLIMNYSWLLNIVVNSSHYNDIPNITIFQKPWDKRAWCKITKRWSKSNCVGGAGPCCSVFSHSTSPSVLAWVRLSSFIISRCGDDR